MVYTLSTLPKNIQDIFLTSHVLASVKTYKKQRATYEANSKGILAMLGTPEPTPKSTTTPVIWATDNYDDKGKKYGFFKPVNDLEVITPRIEKTKEIQKKRTKEKAEVFTPSWVCNLQNNLIDDETVYPGAFNSVGEGIEGQKTWIPSESPVKFEKDQDIVNYIMSPRLEATCGEAPYLVSRYDTVSGEELPVVDENGRYARIGILDRKLRVVSENAETQEDWLLLATEAVRATYGYEWQGDNLLLARLNILNTFIDYYNEFFKTEEGPSLETLEEIAVIISWNIWQMDGLKMVQPLSCSDSCRRCDKSKLKHSSQKYYNHDGVIPVIMFGGKLTPFENLVMFNVPESERLIEV